MSISDESSPFWTDLEAEYEGRAPREFRTRARFKPIGTRSPAPIRLNGAEHPLPILHYPDIEPDLLQSWILKGLIPKASEILIVGAFATAKTFLTLDMVLHAAAGLDWNGHKVEQGAWVYLAAEGQSGLTLRVAAWKQRHPEATDVQFSLIPSGADLFAPEPDLSRLKAAMAEAADRWGGLAGLCVDTLARVAGDADENSSDISRLVANIASVCEPYGCARLLVHHVPYAAKRPRGHSSLPGGADVMILVECDGEPGGVRTARVIKQKDESASPDFHFKLERVELGRDLDGDLVTSCIVVPVAAIDAALPAGPKVKLSTNERIALTELGRALELHGEPVPTAIPNDHINRAKVGKVARLDAWRERFDAVSGTGPDFGSDKGQLLVKTGSDKKPDSSRRAFDRARKSLQSKEIIGVYDDFAWLTFAKPGQSGQGPDKVSDKAGWFGQSGQGSFREPLSVSVSEAQSVKPDPNDDPLEADKP